MTYDCHMFDILNALLFSHDKLQRHHRRHDHKDYCQNWQNRYLRIVYIENSKPVKVYGHMSHTT